MKPNAGSLRVSIKLMIRGFATCTDIQDRLAQTLKEIPELWLLCFSPGPDQEHLCGPGEVLLVSGYSQ